jgi:uncharacterized protein YodC (DUF2158 family)
MAEGFSVGDVVVLKSGGPRMTISYVQPDGKNVSAYWFDGNERKSAQFATLTLKRAEDDEVLRGSSGERDKLRGY